MKRSSLLVTVLAVMVLAAGNARATDYNDAVNGNWDANATWGVAGYPSAGADTAVIDSQTVTITNVLPSITSITVTNVGVLKISQEQANANTVTVYGTVGGGTGTVYQIASPITNKLSLSFNGGWFRIPNSQSPYTFNNGMNVNVDAGGMVYIGAARNGGGQYTTFSGLISGSGKIKLDPLGQLAGLATDEMRLMNSNNTFTGDFEINRGDTLTVCANGAMGAGLATVNSNATLKFWEAQSQTKIVRVLVHSGGTMKIDRPAAGPGGYTAYVDATIDGGTVLDASGYGGTFVFAGTNTLTADSYYNDAGKGDAQLQIDALVLESGGARKITRTAGTATMAVIFTNPNNNYSGGTECQNGIICFTTTGAYGKGPITVLNSTTFKFDASSDQDWAFTNSLYGKGTIQIEAGSGSKKLTIQGGTVGPGTNSAGAGAAILNMHGDFQFAANAGTPARLNIDVPGVGGVAGTDFDQLAVDHGTTTSLGNSITNCDLYVNATPSLQALNGQNLTIVTNAGVDFTGKAFNSTNWSGSGATGQVIYANGGIQIKFDSGAPVIANRYGTNVTGNSATLVGYLSSTGAASTYVTVFWGKSNALTQAGNWETNQLLAGTKDVGAISNDVSGLTANTNYWFAYFASNSAGVYWAQPSTNFFTGVIAPVFYTNAPAGGNWTNPPTWVPTGVPIKNTDTATITGSTVEATTAMAAISNIAVTAGTLKISFDQQYSNTVAVSSNGTFFQNVGTITNGPVLAFNGGWFRIPNADPWKYANWMNVQVGPGGMVYVGIPRNDGTVPTTFNGVLSGSGKLSIDAKGLVPLTGTMDQMTLANTNNTFTGDIDINNGSLAVYAEGAMGPGLATVKSGAAIIFGENNSAAKTAHVLVQSGGIMQISRPLQSPKAVYVDATIGGATVMGASGESWGGTWKFNGTNTLTADSFYSPGDKSDCNLEIAALVVESGGPRKITRTAGSVGQPVTFSNPSNNYSGGTECRQGIIRFTTTGSYGTGPIAVASNATIQFDATPDQNWTITNALGGVGTNMVETGSGNLTVAGRAVSPGTNTAAVSTNNAGILTVWGSLALASQGPQLAQLNVKIAGSNNVAGADYDRLVVSNNFSGLSAANLSVSLAPGMAPSALVGQQFTIVTCTNDLTGLKFNLEGWSAGWKGTVAYGPGYVRLSNIFVQPKGTSIIIR